VLWREVAAVLGPAPGEGRGEKDAPLSGLLGEAFEAKLTQEKLPLVLYGLLADLGRPN
jgi:hypothetical protein